MSISFIVTRYLGRLWMRPRQSSSLPSNEGLNRSVVLILHMMNAHDNLEVYAYFQFPCVICCYFLCRYWMPHLMILWHLLFCGCPVFWNHLSGRLYETTLTSIITSSCQNILDLFCWSGGLTMKSSAQSECHAKCGKWLESGAEQKYWKCIFLCS